MDQQLRSAGQTDLVLYNGRIWTENPKQPHAEALAITGSRIAAVGQTTEILPTVGPQTRVIDLKGRRVVPGFNDAHVHLYIGGDTLTAVNLRNVNSPSEFRERIAAHARTRPKGEWILHGSWDHERWSPSALPTHELIDDVTPDHPVWVNRSDGHMMLANSLAMTLAGIDRNTRDVPGGEIVRDSDGNPTGVFKDAAKRLVDHIIPLPSREHIISAIRAAQIYAAENGVTSVQDMGVLGSRGGETMVEVIRAYQDLLRCGELALRISAHLPLPQWKRLANAGVMANFGNDKLRLGGVKSFSDGSLGSTTAWFFDPYTDAPCSCGLPSDEYMDPEAAYANMRDADRAGLQIAVHAIGDRANSVVLDTWERLTNENGARDRRARIEHAQHLRASDLPRFNLLNVIASVQPYHCIDDARWADKRIGKERAKLTYAFRSLIDAGAVVAFGSDWWVAPINPLLSIYAAVTRRPLDGGPSWVPEQAVTVQEAVHAYTYQSAYASGEEHLKGSLEPGKLADIAVLSEDIFEIDPLAIRDVKVYLTVFDGKVIFEREHLRDMAAQRG
ncbi:MAG TPA: amidohydrolase [Candidatus Nanoarchaeia archaeon]|nr:amidohydrolase [Candidatus Nanoarchaeia archaeon]